MMLGLLIAVVAFLPGCGEQGHTEARAGAPATQLASHGGQESVALAWNVAAVEAAKKSSVPGPAIPRALSIIHTGIYDAWAAYDDTAVGTRLGVAATPRRRAHAGQPGEGHQLRRLRAAVDLFPDSQAAFDALMSKLGYDPKDTSTNKATASGIGNVASKAVLDFRHGDGANQLGDAAGSKGPYTDYTGYKPVNAPMDIQIPFDPATVKDMGHWQPLTYVDSKEAVVTPDFLLPYWGKVAAFAMTSGSQLRVPGPAKPGTERFTAQAQALLDHSANLTEHHKVIVHYWAEEGPPPQWNEFAQFVSRRDRHGADAAGTEKDVKMFFALNGAMLDASIAGWGDKAHYDYVRPITAIRSRFKGVTVNAWGGPGKGTLDILGETWHTYHPATFPTPPFAEYGSGHSVFGGAAAEALKLFTGSDTFGHSVTIPAGGVTYEAGVPATAVTLSWATFTAASDEQGISRRYGGCTSKAVTSTPERRAATPPAWPGPRRSPTSTAPRSRTLPTPLRPERSQEPCSDKIHHPIGSLSPATVREAAEGGSRAPGQVRLHALEALCERLLGLGRYGEAIDAALVAVAAEPLRESAHLVLMRAYEAEGNRCEALRAYSNLTQLLRNELGVEPSRRVQAFMRSSNCEAAGATGQARPPVGLLEPRFSPFSRSGNPPPCFDERDRP